MKYVILFESFNNNLIKKRLEDTIMNYRMKFRGGRKFFDAIDDYIKDVKNQDITLEIVKGLDNEWIATSGEYGDILYNLYKEGKFKCKGIVVFNGKMQTNKTDVSNWYPKDFNLNNKNFIYVDDSYFSGSTARKINQFLSNYNSSIIKISVIYDGSKEPISNMKSLIRYYDLDIPSWDNNQ